MALGDRTLLPGSRGDDVGALQDFLNHLRYGPLRTDGVYGPRTADAVRTFQADHGLKRDGVYGPKTHGLFIDVLQYNPPIGDVLAKPYVVRPGDSLYRIGHYYRISVPEIVERNHLINPDQIYVGQLLNLSTKGAPIGSQ